VCAAWKNPHEIGAVTVTCSSLHTDSRPVDAVVGREAVRCVSQPDENQWYTHTHAHAHTHSHTHTHTRTLSLSRSLTHVHAYAHARILTHAHTHTHTLSHTHTCWHALTHTHAQTHTHTRTLTHTQEHPGSNTHTHTRTTHSRFTNAHTHTHTFMPVLGFKSISARSAFARMRTHSDTTTPGTLRCACAVFSFSLCLDHSLTHTHTMHALLTHTLTPHTHTRAHTLTHTLDTRNTFPHMLASAQLAFL